MGIAEGSCTLHVPRKAAFEKKNQPGSKASYIKYGVFTIGGHDWEIQVYLDGTGTVTLHLCLLSSTPAEVVRCEIWTNPDYSDSEIDYANNMHKPNVPKEIDSVTVAPPPKTEDSVTIKVDFSVVEVAAPAKPSNQWDPNSADISFDNNTNKPISKPDSTGPNSSQWNPSNADVSFDGSAKPNKPSAGPGSAWNPSSADVSFDNSTNKPISKPDSAGPGSSQWNPSNADVSFDGSAKPNKPSAGSGSAWNPTNADVSFDNNTNKPVSKPDSARPSSNQWNPNNVDVSFDGSGKPNKPSAGSGSAWNPNNADISFDNSTSKPISKPDLAKPGSNQWNPNNADVSFDGSAKPNKPSAGSGSAWNPSNADVSFDNSFNKPISKPDSTKPGSNQWNPSNADVSFDDSIKPNKPSAGPGSAWNPSSADISFDNAKSS